jgi:hypothetical protein
MTGDCSWSCNSEAPLHLGTPMLILHLDYTITRNLLLRENYINIKLYYVPFDRALYVVVLDAQLVT